MPLQLGLAVHLHDHFASKYLIIDYYINLDFVNHTKKCNVMKEVLLEYSGNTMFTSVPIKKFNSRPIMWMWPIITHAILMGKILFIIWV